MQEELFSAESPKKNIYIVINRRERKTPELANIQTSGDSLYSFTETFEQKTNDKDSESDDEEESWMKTAIPEIDDEMVWDDNEEANTDSQNEDTYINTFSSEAAQVTEVNDDKSVDKTCELTRITYINSLNQVDSPVSADLCTDILASSIPNEEISIASVTTFSAIPADPSNDLSNNTVDDTVDDIVNDVPNVSPDVKANPLVTTAVQIATKKRITFYMNCHGEFLARTLLTSRDFFRKYTCHYVVTFQAIRRGVLSAQEIDDLKNCDIIIYNPVSDKHKQFSASYVLHNLVSPNAKRICIPYYRFKGYWPSFVKREIGNESYRQEFLGPIIDRLDSLLQTEALKNNVSLADESAKQTLIHRIANPANIASVMNSIFEGQEEILKLHLMSTFDYFDELDKLSDIKMVTYFRDHWQKLKLFHNYAHPTPEFFLELAKRLFPLLGLKRYNQLVIRRKTRSVDEDPILPPLKNAYGLQFHENSNLLAPIYQSISLYYYLEQFPQHLKGLPLKELTSTIKHFYDSPCPPLPRKFDTGISLNKSLFDKELSRKLDDCILLQEQAAKLLNVLNLSINKIKSL
jgi:hypothetical protein